MKKRWTELEKQRLLLQDQLDAQKDGSERNRMGQFATPNWLADDMLHHGKMLFGQGESLRFLDPAMGTGAFYSALLRIFTSARISAATGYEIDVHYGNAAHKLWSETGIEIHLKDFTAASAPENGDRFNFLICNPPYVRHHHIGKNDKSVCSWMPRMLVVWRSVALQVCIVIFSFSVMAGWQMADWQDGWCQVNSWT